MNRITTELPDGTGDCFNQNIFHSLSPCMRACTKHVKNSHERNEKDPAIACRSSCSCAYANGALRATPDMTELRATLEKDELRVESNSGLRATREKRFDGISALSMKGPSLTAVFPSFLKLLSIAIPGAQTHLTVSVGICLVIAP